MGQPPCRLEEITKKLDLRIVALHFAEVLRNRETFLNPAIIFLYTMPKKRDTILVFSAHSDDFVLGAGSTIARYAKEGKTIKVIVFSYGEKSHPWLKVHITKKMRAEEAFQASKILGCKTSFLDLHEFKFYEDFQRNTTAQELRDLIIKDKPLKIFTHSQEDPHPDHQAVNKITLELYDSFPSSSKPEIYTYSVWNPVSFRTFYPALYVDATKTFSTKLKALHKFHSQRIHIAYPFLLLVFRSFKDGFHIGKRFGEKFFKIR